MLLKYFQLITLSLLISFKSIAAPKNYASFTTASKIAVIDNELKQAKNFDDLHLVLIKIGEIVFRNFGDTCKEPTNQNYKALCADISSHAKVFPAQLEYFEYTWEQRILMLACVNLGVDNEQTTKRKVQIWWNNYKIGCKCNSAAFALQNGNLLKFAIAQNMPDLIETLASTYECDINFIDPADGLNLFDYVITEISNLKKLGNSENIVKHFEDYKILLSSLGGKSIKK